MKLNGERQISASRQAVWAALNDPAVLRLCIPGCEHLELTTENQFAATISVKVGPVKARMEGAVTLGDIDPPNGYTISGKGKGAAGFASGDAKVALSDHEGGTRLVYSVEAKIGGKLAEVGARFIDSTAQKMADQFFDAFAGQLSGDAPAAPLKPQTASVADPGSGAGNGAKWLLAAAIVALAALALWAFS